MAKKNKRDKKSSKKDRKEKSPEPETMKKKKQSTLEDVEAMSSSEDGSVDQSNKAWNAKAEALENLISGGAYDKIITDKNKTSDDDESIEEAVLGEEDESTEEKRVEKEDSNSEDEEEQADEKADKKRFKEPLKKASKHSESDSNEEEESDEKSDQEEEEEEKQSIFDLNSKALLAKTEELLAEKKGFPWVEKFEVLPPSPLPFGKTDEETGMTIDVHDDLKREVAFYDMAMDAVEISRSNCKEHGVPFSRPDDFFAEMVKSDDHMARVKDRLIFENKKIEAVTQRKSNREQKLRSKEAHANKIAEKSRRKKENLKMVDDWAQGAAANRGGKYSDKEDQKYLKNLSGQKRPWTDRDGNLQSGPNKKRMAANKKYGFGGKQGRFKQNDAKTMNDMSGFNPRGNFGGLGTKKGPGGAGGNRKGKRARDASRSRQR